MRLLTDADAEAAAALHISAGALIPGYHPDRQTLPHYVALYRDEIIPLGDCWGLFEDWELSGFIALLPGWVDHLYVQPALHRRGIATELMVFAQARQDELRLYTFQANAGAKAFYERHGFVIEELTDGDRNEEKMPDMTYLWRRG